MGQEFLLLSQDAQVALTEFSIEFVAAFTAMPQPWAKQFGRSRTSKMLKTTWPIPINAAGYQKLDGDLRYRKLAEKSLSIIQDTWQDGVEELASVIEAPDFIGWDEEPAAMASAAIALPNRIIRDLVEAGGSTLCWDGKNFFDTGHPYNVFDTSLGTYDNTTSGRALSIDSLKLAKKDFRKIKAPNGDPLGLRLTHIMVPAELEETAKDMLEQDMIIQAVGGSFGAVDNRHKGTVSLIVADELTNATSWYGLCLNKPGMYPWIVQDTGAPEVIVHDKSSAKYKQSLKLGVASVIRGNGALALPHAMQKYTP